MYWLRLFIARPLPVGKSGGSGRAAGRRSAVLD
jgi:hypothetical protein